MFCQECGLSLFKMDTSQWIRSGCIYTGQLGSRRMIDTYDLSCPVYNTCMFIAIIAETLMRIHVSLQRHVASTTTSEGLLRSLATVRINCLARRSIQSIKLSAVAKCPIANGEWCECIQRGRPDFLLELASDLPSLGSHRQQLYYQSALISCDSKFCLDSRV